MAPPPEYDKEPKAPDKSVINIPSEDSKALYNLVNDHQANSEAKSTNSSTNAEVENNKHVEALDDGQLRALLDEAITYKCPKDREGKSNLFKELLESVEQDEQACEAAARTRTSGRRVALGPRALPHSNSLQDLVAALAAEPAPRRHQPRHAPVSAQAVHGGSLPSGVDTSFLLSEEPMRGAEYVATVSCFNPLPLAERRVSASDAHGAHDTEPLNRRSKPAFPMTYTARATLEIGSGGVGSGRAVTTTTASNQVRIPPGRGGSALARPSEGKNYKPRGPQRQHEHKNTPEAAHAKDSTARENHFWRDSEYVEKWYQGLDVYRSPLDKIINHFYYPQNVGPTRNAGPGIHARQVVADVGIRSPLKAIPKPPVIDMSCLELAATSYTQHIPVVREQINTAAATTFSRINFDHDKEIEVLHDSVEEIEDEIARKKYREHVGQDLVTPTLSSVNPKNVRCMTIGQPLPLAVNSDKSNQNVNFNQVIGDKSVEDKHHRKTRKRNDRHAIFNITHITAPTKPDNKTGQSINTSNIQHNTKKTHADPNMLPQNNTKQQEEEVNKETAITLEPRTNKYKMKNETELVEMVSLKRSSDTNIRKEFSLFLADQRRLLQAIEISSRLGDSSKNVMNDIANNIDKALEASIISEVNVNNVIKENANSLDKVLEPSNSSEVMISNVKNDNSNNTDKALEANNTSEVNIKNVMEENSNSLDKALEPCNSSEVNINNVTKDNSNNIGKVLEADNSSEFNINNVAKENSINMDNVLEPNNTSEVNMNNVMKENSNSLDKAPEPSNSSEININNVTKENSNNIDKFLEASSMSKDNINNVTRENYNNVVKRLKASNSFEVNINNVVNENSNSIDKVIEANKSFDVNFNNVMKENSNNIDKVLEDDNRPEVNINNVTKENSNKGLKASNRLEVNVTKDISNNKALEASNTSEVNVNYVMNENSNNIHEALEADSSPEVNINNVTKENSNNVDSGLEASNSLEVKINNVMNKNLNNIDKVKEANKSSEVNINNFMKGKSNNIYEVLETDDSSEVNINNVTKENSINIDNVLEVNNSSNVIINNETKENSINIDNVLEASNSSEVNINNITKENSNQIEALKIKNDHWETLKTAKDVDTKAENPLSVTERSVDEVSMMDCSEDKEEKVTAQVVKIKGAVDFKVSVEKSHSAELPSDASIFLTLYKRMLASPCNVDNTVLDVKSAGDAKPVLAGLDAAQAKLPKKKKDKITSRLSRKPHAENSNKKKDIIRNALKKLFFDNITQSDSTKLTGKASTATTSKEVDSAIPFSCITTPEVVASVDAAPAPSDLKIPRNALTSSLATHGVPLPRAAPALNAAADEFKKSLDENGNSVQGFSSPQSGSSQQKKQRRKKSSKNNETVIKSHHIDGYQGNKDLNEVLRFIESAEPERPAKRHDDKKKRSAERRKDKAPRASSLDELSRGEPAAHPAHPARPAPSKPERRSWGDERAYRREPEPDLELTDFQTVTKKRRARRRGEPEPGPERERERPRLPPARARSDRSDSNDDMDSVHSLPSLPTRVAAPPPPPPLPPPPPPLPPPLSLVSYADIARTRHNIPDLIESCNYYGEGEEAPARGACDADAYPALSTRTRRAAKPAAESLRCLPPCAPPPAPDVVADRPAVILLDEAQRPRDMEGVTFGFDINEQLVGGEGAPVPVLVPVPVPAAGGKLRYVPPAPPRDKRPLHQIVHYVGTAWEDVVRCGGGKVHYFSE